MNMTQHSWVDDVASYLAIHPQVVLAFLFGSFANGRTRIESDVDLSVYLSEPYSEQDVSDLWGKLEDLTHRDVDLIVLNTAAPGIAWTSMQGKTLVDKNPRRHLELMLEKSGEAEDFREFIVDLLKTRRRGRDEHVHP